jgi:hypothetical protein
MYVFVKQQSQVAQDSERRNLQRQSELKCELWANSVLLSLQQVIDELRIQPSPTGQLSLRNSEFRKSLGDQCAQG